MRLLSAYMDCSQYQFIFSMTRGCLESSQYNHCLKIGFTILQYVVDQPLKSERLSGKKFILELVLVLILLNRVAINSLRLSAFSTLPL